MPVTWNRCRPARPAWACCAIDSCSSARSSALVSSPSAPAAWYLGRMPSRRKATVRGDGALEPWGAATAVGDLETVSLPTLDGEMRQCAPGDPAPGGAKQTSVVHGAAAHGVLAIWKRAGADMRILPAGFGALAARTRVEADERRETKDGAAARVGETRRNARERGGEERERRGGGGEKEKEEEEEEAAAAEVRVFAEGADKGPTFHCRDASPCLKSLATVHQSPAPSPAPGSSPPPPEKPSASSGVLRSVRASSAPSSTNTSHHPVLLVGSCAVSKAQTPRDRRRRKRGKATAPPPSSPSSLPSPSTRAHQRPASRREPAS